MQDMDDMEIGEIVDYVVTWNNLKFEDEEEVKQATQEDWDLLF